MARSRISRHQGDRGTRCLTPAFIRLPGIVHVCESNSISSHVARKISPVLAAQRIMNSNASLTLSLASEPWSATARANRSCRKTRKTPRMGQDAGSDLCFEVSSRDRIAPDCAIRHPVRPIVALQRRMRFSARLAGFCRDRCHQRRARRAERASFSAFVSNPDFSSATFAPNRVAGR